MDLDRPGVGCVAVVEPVRIGEPRVRFGERNEFAGARMVEREPALPASSSTWSTPAEPRRAFSPARPDRCPRHRYGPPDGLRREGSMRRAEDLASVLLLRTWRKPASQGPLMRTEANGLNSVFGEHHDAPPGSRGRFDEACRFGVDVSERGGDRG